MSVFRIAASVLLLTTWGLGQSSSTSSTSATPDANQTQTPSQQPTSPLEEPKKPTEAELNKPTQSTFDVPNAGTDQQIGEIKMMTRYTEINGDPTRSFRVPGSNNLAEFNYFSDKRIFATHRIQILSSFRTTDDHSIDPERVSLQKGYVRIFSPKDEVVVGDSLVSYSRLSFNQNVKGVSTAFQLTDNWKMQGVAGIFIDRWGSLYKDLLGRPYMAAVEGVRLERNLFGKESKLGFNFSNSEDQLFSLPATANGTSPFPAANTVGSVDVKLQSKRGLRLESEFGYSVTDFDSRFVQGGCTAPCDTRIPQSSLNNRQGDFGARVEGSYRYKRISFRGSYVRYEPNFASVNARQIADLQDFVFRTSYDLTTWLTADGTIRRSNNDLKGQLPFETTVLGPEGRFIIHDLAFYKRATFEFGYRHRDTSASDRSVNRFVRIPYAEFSIPVSSTFFTIGYERRGAIDFIDPSQTSNTDRVYAGIRGLYTWGHWDLNPSVRYEFENTRQRPNLNSTPIDPFEHPTSNRLANVTLFVQAPRYFMLEGAYRSSSATIFGPAGFNRPSYRGAISYKFRNDENTVFTFGFERNSNFFAANPNYDERMWSGTFVYRFGKRAQ